MTTMQTSTTSNQGQVEEISAHTARQWLDNNEAVLVDVREPFENKACCVTQATNVPLGSVNPKVLPDHAGKKLIFHCAKGARSMQAAKKLAAEGIDCYSVAGGIEAWKEAGLPTVSSGKPVMDVQRQVFIIVGSMALIGGLLAILVNPWWALLAAIPGAGLINAGVTGLCPLAKVIGLMPWNRV